MESLRTTQQFADNYETKQLHCTQCFVIKIEEYNRVRKETKEYQKGDKTSSNQPLCYDVIVYPQDFSKACDNVRHSAVLDKYMQFKMPHSIYNWIKSFFRDHSHCTSFGNEYSEFRKIMKGEYNTGV